MIFCIIFCRNVLNVAELVCIPNRSKIKKVRAKKVKKSKKAKINKTVMAKVKIKKMIRAKAEKIRDNKINMVMEEINPVAAEILMVNQIKMVRDKAKVRGKIRIKIKAVTVVGLAIRVVVA